MAAPRNAARRARPSAGGCRQEARGAEGAAAREGFTRQLTALSSSGRVARRTLCAGSWGPQVPPRRLRHGAPLRAADRRAAR
eukprot:354186-Chlamydomonas_euryale.AAC.6